MQHTLKKLALLASAAAIAGGLSGAAGAMTRAEIDIVGQYVEAGDIEGLRAYILANPQVMNNTPLGRELRSFVETPPSGGLFSALGFTNPMPSSVRESVASAKSDPSLY